MIRSGFYLKGLYQFDHFDSPAIALGCSFLAIGALLKNIGFNFQQSFSSTFFTYALPGQLVILSLFSWSIFSKYFYCSLVSERPFISNGSFDVSIIKKQKQPKWKYYFSCHFLAVSSWLIMKKDYRKINGK